MLTKETVIEVLTRFGKNPEKIDLWVKSLDDEDMLLATQYMDEIIRSLPGYEENTELITTAEQLKKVAIPFEEELNSLAAEKLMKEVKIHESGEKVKSALIHVWEELKRMLLLEPNNETHKKVILDIIELQKEYGIYDAAYWEDIAHLL